MLNGGETVLDDFRVEYTPGHASHHVSYLHEPTGTALVGDVAGVRIPPADYVMAPTPPPDIDVEAWERSIDLVAGWAPAALALTHFGRVDDVGPHLAAMRERLHEIVGLAAQHGAEAFAAGIRERIERNARRRRRRVPPGGAAGAPLPRRPPLSRQARRGTRLKFVPDTAHLAAFADRCADDRADPGPRDPVRARAQPRRRA